MQSNNLPAAVIFDMDGVLVDSEPVHTACYIQAFAEAGYTITSEQYRQAITLGHSTAKKLFLSIGGDIEQWPGVMKRKGALVKGLMHERAKLMPGIVELLDSLKAADVPTALATSAGLKSLDAVMSKFDLRPYFRHIVTWEDVSAIKPEPDAYLKAAEKLGVECCQCVAIEDSPRGVLAAHRAGMKCIAVPTSTTHDGDFTTATLVVKSLENVDLGVIRELFE